VKDGDRVVALHAKPAGHPFIFYSGLRLAPPPFFWANPLSTATAKADDRDFAPTTHLISTQGCAPPPLHHSATPGQTR
jgi:hypothetical protein